MWREIASFNGSVLVLNVEINDCLCLYLSCFEYKSHINTFVVTVKKNQTFTLKTLELPREPTCDSFACLGFKVLLDRQFGIFLPYFVAQINDDLCYLFCFDSETCQWIIEYYFEVPKVLGQTVQLNRVMDYSITNGPTIIWIVGNEIFIYKAEYSSPKAVCLLRLSVEKTGVEMNILNSSKILWWDTGLYHPCDSEQGLVVFKENESLAMSAYLVTIDKANRMPSIISTSIIPSAYLPVTTFSTVFYQRSITIKNNLTNVPLYSNRVFISTSQSQLVEFFEGQYVKHVNIPLPACQSVDVFENHTGDLILLCCQENQICAVDWKSCTIIRTWLSYHNMLIDDFIGAGIDQVLLFSEHSKEQQEILEEFSLSDFLGDDLIRNREKRHCESVCVKEFGTIQSEENSMTNVMHALMQKVKATEMSIIECKIEKSEKSSFVKKHCDVLHDILMNRKPVSSFQSSSLANLLVGPESCVDEGANHKYSKLVVISKWQNLCNCNWIVGVEVENVGERSVSDIFLCLVNKKPGVLQSRSNACITSENTKECESNSEEHTMLNTTLSLAPGQKVTIATSSRMPDYTSERHFSAGLMLSWKQKDDGYHRAQYCGEIVLSVDDVLNHETKKPFVKPRVCRHLTLSHLETQLIVTARNTNTSGTIELLKSKMDVCQYCSKISSFDAKYHFRTSLLNAVHVSLVSVQNSAIITIFTRDYSQLFMAFYMLNQYLPDDIKWLPLRNPKLIRFAVKCVEEEVMLSVKKMTNLLKIESKTNLETGDIDLTSEKNEETSVKRRKLSNLKDNVQRQYDRTLDLSDCLRTFSDICCYVLETEQTFESFMLLWKTVK